MTKFFIEMRDHSGWAGAWNCLCRKQDFEHVHPDERRIVLSHAEFSDVGLAVNDILKPEEH